MHVHRNLRMFHAHKSLSNRILRTCNSSSQEIPANVHGTYQSWTDLGLYKALAHVDKGLSIRKVSEMYGIFKSTLHDHVSGKILFGAKCGPDPYVEEEELACFLVRSAEIGYPRKHLLWYNRC